MSGKQRALGRWGDGWMLAVSALLASGCGRTAPWLYDIDERHGPDEDQFLPDDLDAVEPDLPDARPPGRPPAGTPPLTPPFPGEPEPPLLEPEPPTQEPPEEFPDLPPEVEPCSCEAPRECDAQSQCVCPPGWYGDSCETPCDSTQGEYEEPAGSGMCVLDPCRTVECAEGALCIAEGQSARCQCPEGWYGPLCDHRFHLFSPPPVTSDLYFDGEGNGWFFTNRGLLRWDENGTQGELDDDVLTLMSSGSTLKALAAGPGGELWFVQDKGVALYDDQGTPHDPSDDTYRQSKPWFSSYSGIDEIVFDKAGRLWVIPWGSSGVRILEDLADFQIDPPPLLSLLEEHTILDLVFEGSAVWALTPDSLLLGNVGPSLSDTQDDEWVEASDGVLPEGASFRRLFLGPDGTKWVDTTAGIFTLTDGGQPWMLMNRIWVPWEPTAAEKAEGNGSLLQVGPDGSPWLLLPSQAIVRLSRGQGAPGPGPVIYDLRQYAPFREASGMGVSALGVRTMSQLWVLQSGTPWVFDHGRTPLDPSDDQWFALARPDGAAISVAPAQDGSAWITATTPRRTPRNCSDLFFHITVGDLNDGTDDTFNPSPRPEGTEGCLDWLKADGRGTLWVGTTSMLFEDRAVFAQSLAARPWTDTPEWLVLLGNEPESSAPLRVAPGDEFVWRGGARFGWGQSLSDSADDTLVPMGIEAPSALSRDAAGYYWLAFDSEAASRDGRLRRLDDGGTPLDPDDDAWQPFFAPAEPQIAPIVELQVDGTGRKWMRNNPAIGGDHLSSFDDGGTPSDPSDDQWRVYLASDETFVESVNAIQTNADGPDLWVATWSTFGFLETKRDANAE